MGLRVLSGDCGIDGCEGAVSRHIEPTPRLQVGRMVAKRGIASSMIDVSDGLFCDLEKLTSEHGLGAEVSLGSIPLSPGFLSLCGRFSEDGYRLALSGGEDYELLFTSSARNRASIEEVSRLCGIAISKIGSVTAGRKIRFFDKGGRRFFTIPGGLSTSADSSTGVEFFGRKFHSDSFFYYAAQHFSASARGRFSPSAVRREKAYRSREGEFLRP